MISDEDIVAPPDDYVCTLDEAALEKAKRELNEDPRERMGAVEALRKWLKEQNYLTARTDTRYLLAFLRGAKFSQLRAREMIEGTLTMATEYPEMVKNIDPCNPKIVKALDTGFVLPIKIPDKNGCRVLFQRPGMIDPESKEYGLYDQMKAGHLAAMSLFKEEATQIHGLVFIMDFTGYTMKHAKRFSFDFMKKMTKMWQGNAPGRFKAFHYYNTGPVFENLFAMMRPFLSKKFSDRIRMHGSNFESIYKHVPMECLPADYLPDDYTGPHAGTVREIVENLKAEVQEEKFRQLVIYDSHPKWKVDLSKKPKSDEPQASFRKLNID